MEEFRKRNWYRFALCASFIPFIFSPIAYTADIGQEIAANEIGDDSVVTADTYTINFNNVSIIELIRFASKITNLNFVFDETDLKFSVSVISEEAVTAKSFMAALSQVLRMHDLILQEQEGNVLITTSAKVNQIPPIISSELPGSKAGNAAIVTRVFRIKNANVTSIAAIIRPMISEGALIEISPETRQLIVTDITTNVDQIASLLLSLDAPHSALDIEVYEVKNIAPVDLIVLSEQILKPFSDGNPLIFVPQVDTNSIFIVSTPYLIERAMTVMEDLDVPPRAAGASKATTSFFVYKVERSTQAQMERSLKQLEEQLNLAPKPDKNLIAAIDSMKWVKESNSFIFTGTDAAIKRLCDIVPTFDVGANHAHTEGYFLYKLQFAKCEVIQQELKTLATKMPSSNEQYKSLVETINKMECVPSNNSLLITGSSDSIEQVKALISEFDTASMTGVPNGAQSFLIYKPKFVPGEQIQAALNTLSEDLQASGLNDPQLFQVVTSMRYVAETNSLLFTGSQDGLDKVQELINGIDTTATLGSIQKIGNLTFLLYKVQSASPNKLISSLKSFAAELGQANVEDRQLTEAINNVKWIKDTNSLLFTGNSSALEKVDQLVKKFDLPGIGGPTTNLENATSTTRQASTFTIYNPRYLSGDELISILCDFMQNLMASGVSDPGLFDTINNLKWIDKTSSLLISGDPQSVEKVQQLLIKFDIPSKENAAPSIESIDNTSFLVYKLQYHPGNDIQEALKLVAASLARGTTTPASLVDAINSLQWIQITNSLLCTGQQDVLVRLKELIQNLDIPLRQVFIEVLVIDTTLQNQQNFGLQWGSQVQYFNKTVLQTGNFPYPAPPSSLPVTNPSFPSSLQSINTATTPTSKMIPFTTGFDLGVIGDIIMHKGKSFISLGSLVNALQQDTDSTIILNPKIITQDNRQSTVFVGQNIPYTGAIVTNQSNSTVQTSNIEYRDVGVSLTITPILGDGDIITLDIVHDISQVINGATATNTNVLTGITTSHTHMETRVHVPDNHFVALSGMINDTKTHYKSSIPCLGGLPVVGVLFSENDRTASKNNVIIFVRPQIVKTYQEYKAITEHQEWLYKDNARLPILKEEFDEGIDMVKIPENE